MTARKFLSSIWLDIVSLAVIGVVFVVPFLFIVLTAAKTRQEAAMLRFSWPSEFRLVENLREVMAFGDNRMLLALWNSTVLTVGSVTRTSSARSRCESNRSTKAARLRLPACARVM